MRKAVITDVILPSSGLFAGDVRDQRLPALQALKITSRDIDVGVVGNVVFALAWALS